jgi:ribosomal protein L31
MKIEDENEKLTMKTIRLQLMYLQVFIGCHGVHTGRRRQRDTERQARDALTEYLTHLIGKILKYHEYSLRSIIY